MFSYYTIPDPNLDHTGFYIISAATFIVFIIGLWELISNYNTKKDSGIFWFLVIMFIINIIAYFVSTSEWDIPDNKEYTAKFIRFVPEQEKHSGPKGQISYTNRIYCEYELTINNKKVLMDCNSKQSHEYIKIYWNSK